MNTKLKFWRNLINFGVLVFLLLTFLPRHGYSVLKITLTITEGNETRVIDGFAVQNGYMEIIQDVDGKDIPNPETKEEYFRRKLIEYGVESVKSQEVEAAVDVTRKNISDAIDAETLIE